MDTEPGETPSFAADVYSGRSEVAVAAVFGRPDLGTVDTGAGGVLVDSGAGTTSSGPGTVVVASTLV